MSKHNTNKSAETAQTDAEVLGAESTEVVVATNNPAGVPAELRGKMTATEERLLAELNLGDHLKLKGIKTVTRPVLKQEDGVAFAVKIIGAIHKGEALKGTKRDGTPQMEPANICHVVNLQTGEEQTLIANAAMQTGLEQCYKDEGYVGKCFAMISRLRPHDGGKKQIREYMIKELEVEGV